MSKFLKLLLPDQLLGCQSKHSLIPNWTCEEFCLSASSKLNPDPVLISACVPDTQPGFSLFIPHLTAMIVICRSSHYDDTIVKISFLPYLLVFSLPMLRYLIKCKFCYLINVIFLLDLDEITQIMEMQCLSTTMVMQRRSGPELLMILRIERIVK